MKKLKWIVLGAAALVVVAIVVVLMNLNSIVRGTVESQSAKSLNVPATLGGASVSVLGGDVSLRNYVVGSPAGYKAPAMLTLGTLAVDTSWSGLRSEPLRVEAITIDKPTFVLEMNGTTFNVKKFIEGLPPDDSETMKLIIGQLNVTGAQVLFRPDAGALSAFPGLADKLKPEYALTIPDLSLADIGTADGNANGVAVKDVVTQLLTTLAARSAESEQLPPELRAILSGDLSNVIATLREKGMAEATQRIGAVTETLKAKLDQELGGKAGEVTNMLKNPDAAKGAVQGAAKDAANKAVGDLLGGLKKEPTTKP
jgi:hypothetical protein